MKMKQIIGGAALGLFGLVLSSAAQAQINEHTFRIGINGAPGHPVVVGAEKWAEILKQKSGEVEYLKGGSTRQWRNIGSEPVHVTAVVFR